MAHMAPKHVFFARTAIQMLHTEALITPLHTNSGQAVLLIIILQVLLPLSTSYNTSATITLM